jgi:hypothetical protein
MILASIGVALMLSAKDGLSPAYMEIGRSHAWFAHDGFFVVARVAMAMRGTTHRAALGTGYLLHFFPCRKWRIRD